MSNSNRQIDRANFPRLIALKRQDFCLHGHSVHQDRSDLDELSLA